MVLLSSLVQARPCSTIAGKTEFLEIFLFSLRNNQRTSGTFLLASV